MRHLTPLLAALAIAFAPPAAQAAQPFKLGAGSHPDVSVDSDGTAHVVWDEQIGGADDPDNVHYCQIPPGASSCQNEKVFTPPLESIGRSSYVFADGDSRVLVETYRCCSSTEGVTGNYVFESNDGGLTFGSARHIGNIDHQENAVFGPGESISGASVTNYQQMPLSGGAGSEMTEFDSGFPVPTHSGMALFGGSEPFQVMSDGSHTSFVRYVAGDPNSTASWSPAVGLTPIGDEPREAGGPSGAVLLYTVGEPGKFRLVARKFDGTTFGAPVTVSETGDPFQPDISADPVSGRFDAVWVANGVSPNELRWSFSDDGLTWSPPQTVIAGAEADDAFNLQVSGGPNGKALAVWDQNGATGQARAIVLDPGENGAASSPADSVVVGGEAITLFAPPACVNPGVKITLRVTHKIKKLLSPKKRVKIVNVVFSLDKTQKKDKKAAFKATFGTKKLKAGSTHKLRAKVLLKPAKGKGKAQTKTLKGSLKICGQGSS